MMFVIGFLGYFVFLKYDSNRWFTLTNHSADLYFYRPLGVVEVV